MKSKRATVGVPSTTSAEAQLESFLAKYNPEIARDARECHSILRSLVPGAVEMVYDNYNALVIGFSPSERASEAILSIAVMPRWVDLCFVQDASTLPDPLGLLKGSGKVARHIVLESPRDLDKPSVRALLTVALERARVPIDPGATSRLIIKSISAKQRPRRPS